MRRASKVFGNIHLIWDNTKELLKHDQRFEFGKRSRLEVTYLCPIINKPWNTLTLSNIPADISYHSFTHIQLRHSNELTAISSTFDGPLIINDSPRTITICEE